GIVAFLDHVWNKKFSSSVGYSMVSIDNSSGQAPEAYKMGQYVLANLLYTPVPNVMMGIEGGWIHRENNKDGVVIDDPGGPFDGLKTEKVDQYHVQVSAKYSFALPLGGGQ